MPTVVRLFLPENHEHQATLETFLSVAYKRFPTGLAVDPDLGWGVAAGGGMHVLHMYVCIYVCMQCQRGEKGMERENNKVRHAQRRASERGREGAREGAREGGREVGRTEG